MPLFGLPLAEGDYKPNDRKLPGRNRRVIKGPRIHNNYNVWVKRLAKRIAVHARIPA